MLAAVASVSNQVCDAAQLISTDFCWKCFKSNFEIWDIIAITKVCWVIKKTPANKTSDQTRNYTSICWSNQAWLYLALPGRDFILHRCNWYWSCHCSKVNWYLSVRAVLVSTFSEPGNIKTASDRRVPEHFPFILKIRFHFLVLRYFSDPIWMFSHWYSAAQWGC